MGAVVRRPERRQEAGPFEHHLPSAQPDPLRAGPARRCEAAEEAERQGIRRTRSAAAPRPGEVLRENMPENSIADSASTRWYALTADEIAERLAVDPDSGLTAAKAAEKLQSDG